MQVSNGGHKASQLFCPFFFSVYNSFLRLPLFVGLIFLMVILYLPLFSSSLWSYVKNVNLYIMVCVRPAGWVIVQHGKNINKWRDFSFSQNLEHVIAPHKEENQCHQMLD